MQYTSVSLQTRLHKILAETNNLQLGTLTAGKLLLTEYCYHYFAVKSKITDFCQIEPGTHTSTIPSSWSKHNQQIFSSQGNTVQASDFETGAKTHNFPWRKIKITKCERCTAINNSFIRERVFNHLNERFVSNRTGYDMRYIWNNSYIWTAVVDQSEEWSSQKIFQFKQLERRSLKKSRLQRDSNPWPPRYRCDAPPTELWSHTLGARSIYWVHISREEWNDVKYIWNNSYIWTAVVDQSEEWSSQ